MIKYKNHAIKCDKNKQFVYYFIKGEPVKQAIGHNHKSKMKYISFLRMTLIFFLLSLTSAISVFSQSGMRFPELVQRIEPYFDEALIEDVKKQLPQGSDFKIWGWDVGDYSGDGYMDLAITIKLAAEKNQISHIYLFVDIDGYLTNVSKFTEEFVDLPLEIGVVIRYNTCYITKKVKRFNWIIKGYRFDNGILVLQDKFETEQIGKYTHEKTTNYQTLQNNEKYIITNNNTVKFSSNYLTIPSFYRSRLVYKGFRDKMFSNYIDYVHKGAYYWTGDKDCSFSIKSAYDEKYLYMSVYINDDKIVNQLCDTCPGDFIEVWFDVSYEAKRGNRIAERKGKNIKFREKPKGRIFSFKIYPGDFHTKKAFLKDVSTTDDLYDFQRDEVYRIKAVSSLRKNAYVIKFKIAFLLFGYDGPPIENDNISEFGCTVVVHDIDNEFRPEEETEIATSIFDSSNPSSYGNLILIPKNKWYGESSNIFKNDILKHLNEYGF